MADSRDAMKTTTASPHPLGGVTTITPMGEDVAEGRDV